MSSPALEPEREPPLDGTRLPELWGGCLIAFLVINDVSTTGRVWGTWKSVGSRRLVVAEEVLIIASRTWTINFRDPDHPANLSNPFEVIEYVKRSKKPVWCSFVDIVLWFLSATAFYISECQPAQWCFPRCFAQ
ncbi:hypothetical protein GGS23DRAFT_591940 [Durotheca rogersii]|uniref:uncharacterized protein n=1 Tax=Durotheca rogersii TaxID=419775 RepID=UPI00221E3983|nr:uncharacterized protein GGS23DRAFT_591940 [Durotheca rogersii]KAI5868144.1 hypothetical protein GGS23DRAFT_591940 [Durotheca rogersii]